LRTDADLMARHYGRQSRTSLRGLHQTIGAGGAAGYTLLKNLPRTEPAGFYAKQFRRRWMSYSATGPFIIDPRNLPPESEVAYVSCGVPHDFSTRVVNEVREALERASFIGLRDEESADKLRRAGVKRELHVAPDLTVTLSDQFDREDLTRRGREIVSRFGVSAELPLICLQSQPYPGFHEADIISELRRYQQKRDVDIVALPLGYCHGDHEFLQSLARQSGGMIKYADVYSVFDMLAIIAASDVFVGTSLHGNITAFSFGIPHVIGPLPVAKTIGFLEVASLPADLRMESWQELDEKIEGAVKLGRDYFLNKASAAKLRTYQLLDEMGRG
ncbi:MAG TPA: polysaccharide pyruvyl transferase family protein, partial [Pyrinomonadaceae bacterium]|nr:polysaccharide pyruvyl transferase family protein [Pyrinomonadaceae bacterium]